MDFICEVQEFMGAGRRATPDPYALQPSFILSQGGHNGQQLQGYTNYRVPNATLSPLTSTTFEIGTDLGFSETD